MRHVLLTGGLGFIGRHLVDRLLQEDYKVSILDDFTTGKLQNVAQHENDQRLSIVNASILDGAKISKPISDADAVVHLAAITSVIRSAKEPRLVHDVNVTGTLNVLESCVKHSVGRFLFVSSAAVYGNSAAPPFKENLPARPLSLYGSTKAAGEAYCQAYHETHNLGTVVIRLMNIYGPRRSAGPYAGVMMKFADAVLARKPVVVYGDGQQTRDFTYVSDAANGILLALQNRQADGEIFNIGTGNGCTVNHLAELFQEMSGSHLEVLHEPSRPGEVRESYADLSKSNRLLGYSPQIALKDGLNSFFQWYRESLLEKFEHVSMFH